MLTLLGAGCTGQDDAAHKSGSGGRAASAPAAPSAEVDRYASVRRPWAVAPLAARERCPVTRHRAQPDPRLAGLWGDGPARPAGLGPGAVLEYMAAAAWKDATWGGAKVLWAVDPAVTGLVLIRGKRLDAPGQVAFEDPPTPELGIDVDRYQGLSGGWKDYPSYTRLRAPGCYLYQVDTAQGTSTVVFTARGPQI
ncbi:hypothetical protein [Spirilliplanes yamanashiensis]|uniref:hypothetical protein n=1 Tax=Spirilliplanes yamanashiensis TaxID=42233 RepID=UPI00194FA63A|nr:hypothetical protein [Spirilliplanes yamanashiensis]MDP9818297.1 hypothetical protein [Spirilliplanes yamanashiensis]